MGKPRGFARSFSAPAASTPVAPEQIATFSTNSRLDITCIVIGFHISQPGRYSRVNNAFASGTFVIFKLAASQSSLRPPNLNETEAKFTASGNLASASFRLGGRRQ